MATLRLCMHSNTSCWAAFGGACTDSSGDMAAAAVGAVAMAAVEPGLSRRAARRAAVSAAAGEKATAGLSATFVCLTARGGNCSRCSLWQFPLLCSPSASYTRSALGSAAVAFTDSFFVVGVRTYCLLFTFLFAPLHSSGFTGRISLVVLGDPFWS